MGKFNDPQSEPLFMATSREDPAMLDAHAQALATIGYFRDLLTQRTDAVSCAKLKFRDPDHSENIGEDRFVYLWLSAVVYHEKENVFSAAFFEVPPELEKWHQVGQRLAFEAEDIFDWMVLDSGHLHGGFTMRIAREALPAPERAEYDRYVGVSLYEPLPK